MAVRHLNAVRELGSERRETVRSLSAVGVGRLRRVAPSTRGPGVNEPLVHQFVLAKKHRLGKLRSGMKINRVKGI